MATITPSVPTGYYMDHQTVRFNVSNDIREMAVTQGNSPPSISKYIAYDTLTPPNPFLAVTEDGRGRVVYDGGFPKFYNNASYNGATSFAGLNGSCKFLYNAIHWVKNAEKYAAGNRKILILGDCFNDSVYYSVKSIGGDGFRNTMTMVGNIAGMQVDFLNCSDWGGNTNGIIDLRLAKMEEYLLIIFFGCHSAGPAGGIPNITNQSVNDMVSYRENGNGLIFITDHGRDYANVNEVIADSTPSTWGFFKTVNRVIVRFGAFFTGDYNRTPVNVGFLRNTYGNHPLYNNLADSENIIAGGSESKVVVTTSTTYAPSNLPAMTTSVNGINYINVLAVLTDGSMVSARFTYIIAGEEILFVKDANNDNVVGSLKLLDDGGVGVAVDTNGAALGTVWGEILIDGVRVGSFYEASGVKRYNLYAGNQTRAKPGSVVEVKTMIPFTYSKKITVTGGVNLGALINEARVVKVMVDSKASTATPLPVLRAFSRYISDINARGSIKFTPMSKARQLQLIKDANNKALGSTGALTMAMHGTDAQAITAVNNGGAPMVNHAVNYVNGNVIAWQDGAVRVLNNVKANQLFPKDQVIVSNGEAGTWKMNANGSFTKTS